MGIKELEIEVGGGGREPERKGVSDRGRRVFLLIICSVVPPIPIFVTNSTQNY